MRIKRKRDVEGPENFPVHTSLDLDALWATLEDGTSMSHLNSLMSTAVETHDVEAVRIIFINGAGIRYGQTRAELEELLKRPDLLAIFLEHGYDMSTIDLAMWENPLALCAAKSEMGGLRILLSHAGHTFTDEEKNTALGTAIFHANYAIMKLLLEHGADANGFSYDKRMLHRAVDLFDYV